MFFAYLRENNSFSQSSTVAANISQDIVEVASVATSISEDSNEVQESVLVLLRHSDRAQ